MGSFHPIPPPSSSSSSTPPLLLDLTLATYTPPPVLHPKPEPKLEPLSDDDDPSHPSPTPNPSSDADPLPLQQLFPSSQEEDLLSRFYPPPSTSSTDLTVVPTGPLADLVLSSKRKKPLPPRSADMVRVSSLSDRDERYFRNLVRRTRATYECLRVLLCYESTKSNGFPKCRADSLAATLMANHGLSLNRDKRIIGAIPGVQIGDIFFYRLELCVLGLHGQTQAGIDSVPASRTSNGEPIATSIVVSGGYEDDEDTGNVIVYTGHGGKIRHNLKHSVNQKLESGNLALERSKFYNIEVRVIRGFKFAGSPSNKIYVYDGLYRIVDYWLDVGKSGFEVFKYRLVRIADQDEMGSSLLMRAQEMKEKLRTTRPDGYLSHDISMGKDNLPVALFNDIDGDPYPMHFEYLVKPVYPPSVLQQRGYSAGCGGCQCVSGCADNCPCADKNWGEFAYDYNGILLMGKPLIYECGSSCRCPPTCRNRVSQKGVKHRLEVFRSRETGWGVRSLDLVRAGSFICEYTGIVLTKQQSELLAMNGDSLISPSCFLNSWCEWGDLSQVVPQYSRPTLPPLPPLDFAIDVSRSRNVACYLSHSCTPNVFVQFVLYDHYDVSYPHLMIFAMENIPPMKELSIDYGVRDDIVEGKELVVKDEQTW